MQTSRLGEFADVRVPVDAARSKMFAGRVLVTGAVSRAETVLKLGSEQACNLKGWYARLAQSSRQKALDTRYSRGQRRVDTLLTTEIAGSLALARDVLKSFQQS